MGATGGGYILSGGTRSAATFHPGPERQVSVSVNSDSKFNARTTRRAVELLLSEGRGRPGVLQLEQTVETPIGSGFGASAASAMSAVYATASAVGTKKTRERLASFAHRAEILEQTGLGTVSVIYDHTGAGAITKSGSPGEARFVIVKVPRDLRIVTAFVAPYDKKEALSSKTVSEKINALGRRALEGFLSDPTLESLASEGEVFSRQLGLESPEVKKLIAAAKSSGAEHASQNMIGYAVHSLVHEECCQKVARAMGEITPRVRVDVFEVGSRRAGIVPASRSLPGPS